MSTEAEFSKENLAPSNKARRKSGTKPSKKASSKTKEAAKSLPAKSPRTSLPPAASEKKATLKDKSSKTKEKATSKSAQKAKAIKNLEKALTAVLSRKDKVILVEVVDSWVEFYYDHRQEAMLLLVNLLLEVKVFLIFLKSQAAFNQKSACLTLEQFARFEDSDDSEVLEEILPASTSAMQSEKIWLTAAKQKADLAARTTFLDFWKKLILQCQREVLYDDYFIVQLFHWTLALSHSQSRPLRQTSNLVSLHIQSSLLEVCTRLQNRLSVSERQLEVERTKNQKDAIQDLRTLTKSIKGNLTELEDLLDQVYAGQFEYRRKDVIPLIRSDCVTYLGEWIQLYPSFFNKNNYLAVLGWALSDKDSDVRLAAVKGLTAIFSYEKLIDQLDMFIEHFKARMIQMPSDTDVNVAVQGIGLCTQLAKLNVLNDKEVGDLNSFVFDADGKIRIRAAQFINEYRLEHVVAFEFKARQLNVPKKKGQKQQRRSEEHELATAKLLSLIHLVQEEEELPDYLIDVLWGSCDVLHQWDIMTDLALDPSSDVTITDFQMTILMEFIGACVKRACGVKLVPRAKGEKVHIDSESQIEEYRKQMTAHFLPVLPQLLTKFESESSIIAALVEIPQYFYTEHLDVEGAAEHFKQLRENMILIFQTTPDREVLSKVAQTMDILSKQDNAFSKDTQADILALLEWTFGKFKTNSLNLRASNSSEPSEKQSPKKSATNLLVNLHRLNSFQGCRDIEPVFTDQRSPYFKQLENLVDYISEKPEEEVILVLFDAVQLTILWEYSNFIRDIDSRTEDEGLPADYDVIIEEFNRKVPQHVSVLQAFLKKGTDTVREKCFFLITDMLCAFSQVYARENVIGVDYVPNEELTQLLSEEFKRKMEETVEDENDTENTVINSKEDYLAAFGRVVAFGALSHDIKTFGPEVLIYIDGQGKTITKIVKAFLHHIKERNPNYRNVLSTLIGKTLEDKFLECRAKEDEDEDEIDTYKELTVLAKHLTAIFGITGGGKDESYQALAYVFQYSFKFVAIEPEFRHEYFTHAMTPFISKLDQAAAGVLLERFNVALPLEDLDDQRCMGVFTFKEALESLAGGNRKKNAPATKAKKGRKRKSKDADGDESLPKKRQKTKGEAKKGGTKRKSKDDPNPRSSKRRSKGDATEEESSEEAGDEPEPDTQPPASQVAASSQKDVAKAPSPPRPVADEEERTKTPPSEESQKLKKRKSSDEDQQSSPSKRQKMDVEETEASDVDKSRPEALSGLESEDE